MFSGVICNKQFLGSFEEILPILLSKAEGEKISINNNNSCCVKLPCFYT